MITKTVKYDAAVEPDTYLTKEEREQRAKNPRPHICNPPSLREGEYGPGSIWSCDEGDNPCGMRKQVVHLGVKQHDDSPPLGWRNLGRI